MKKIFILLMLIFFIGDAGAEGIHFTKNKTWKEILELAKKEKKLIFLDAYATWCGPCKYMQSSVFPDSKVGAYFNKNFINVKMDMEEGEGPQLAESFGITAYPTLYFVNGEGKLVHKTVGALEIEGLVELGKNALNPGKQFYTVKEKIIAATASPAHVLEWLQEAKKMEEPKLNDMLFNYLDRSKADWNTNEMLLLMLDHAKRLPEKLIRFLYDNKTRVLQLTGKTEEEYTDLLKDKIVNYAFLLSLKNLEPDFAVFQKTITPYTLLNPALETQIIKVRFFTTKGDSLQAPAALYTLLKDFGSALDAYSMVSLVYDAASLIAFHEQSTDILNLVEAYQVSPAKNEDYYKDLALLSIYYHQGDKLKIAAYANKIVANGAAPKYIQQLAQKMKGD